MPLPSTKMAAHSGFEAQKRCHQKFRTGVLVAPQKGLTSSKFFFFKKNYVNGDETCRCKLILCLRFGVLNFNIEERANMWTDPTEVLRPCTAGCCRNKFHHSDPQNGVALLIFADWFCQVNLFHQSNQWWFMFLNWSDQIYSQILCRTSATAHAWTSDESQGFRF